MTATEREVFVHQGVRYVCYQRPRVEEPATTTEAMPQPTDPTVELVAEEIQEPETEERPEVIVASQEGKKSKTISSVLLMLLVAAALMFIPCHFVGAFFGFLYYTAAVEWFGMSYNHAMGLYFASIPGFWLTCGFFYIPLYLVFRFLKPKLWILAMITGSCLPFFLLTYPMINRVIYEMFAW